MNQVQKRIVVILMGMLTGMSLHAQSLWDRSLPDNKISFGLRAGVGFASTDMRYATSVRTGMHIGATADLNIVKSVSITSGMFCTTKGFKSNFGNGNSVYLQVPVLASYRIETPTGVRFHFNLGPYFAWGIGGSVNYKPYDATFVYDYNQDSFGKKGFFQDFDTGLSAGAYIVLNKLLWGVGYEYGLYDIARVYGKFHNRNVTTTLGFNF